MAFALADKGMQSMKPQRVAPFRSGQSVLLARQRACRRPTLHRPWPQAVCGVPTTQNAGVPRPGTDFRMPARSRLWWHSATVRKRFRPTCRPGLEPTP